MLEQNNSTDEKKLDAIIWKTGVDIGFTFTLLGGISIYPYFRQIMTFGEQFGYGFDLGIAVGFYFHENSKWIF